MSFPGLQAIEQRMDENATTNNLSSIAVISLLATVLFQGIYQIANPGVFSNVIYLDPLIALLTLAFGCAGFFTAGFVALLILESTDDVWILLTGFLKTVYFTLVVFPAGIPVSDLAVALSFHLLYSLLAVGVAVGLISGYYGIRDGIRESIA